MPQSCSRSPEFAPSGSSCWPGAGRRTWPWSNPCVLDQQRRLNRPHHRAVRSGTLRHRNYAGLRPGSPNRCRPWGHRGRARGAAVTVCTPATPALPPPAPTGGRVHRRQTPVVPANAPSLRRDALAYPTSRLPASSPASLGELAAQAGPTQPDAPLSDGRLRPASDSFRRPRRLIELLSGSPGRPVTAGASAGVSLPAR